MFGVVVRAPDARAAVEEVAEAERAGAQSAWMPMSGAGGPDVIPVLAAAAHSTERILLGTSIAQTWSRQPVTFAQEAMAIEKLAPGRFRLGIGPTTEFFTRRLYGLDYDRPLTNLREYLHVIRSLLRDGEVDFEGVHVRTHARISPHALVPVMASALRPKSYELCGELSDGAISWVTPLRYLTDTALPALQAGAAKADRDPPPIIAHVPIAVTTDREAARRMTRDQLATYQRVPNYQGMFALAGYDVSDGYGDDLLDDLVVSGTEAEVADGLQRWIASGVGEVMALPLIADDRATSVAEAYAAVARAAR